jgi:K+-sensing histidine kinase KdpD
MIPGGNDAPAQLKTRGNKMYGAAIAYAVAFISVAATVGVRWALDPMLGDQLPLATLYGAVALTVWVGGYRPAVLAAVSGYLICNHVFMEPRGAFHLVCCIHRLNPQS